jgi:hypothetical protein
VDGAISAAELRRVIVGAFDPVLSAAGFERATELKWVRRAAPSIRHVVEAAPARHGGRLVHWGVSLDFVPHCVGASVRWHRTARSARLDLGFDPLNFRDEWDFTAQPWTIPLDLGAPTPAERARSIAAALAEHAYPWLDAIDGLPSLPAAFEREAARTGGQFGFDDYVQYRLAYAFVLARLGWRDRAESELERWAAREMARAAVLATLRDLLGSAGAAGSPPG